MKATDLIKALDICIDIKRPVMVWGSPGIGKSRIMAEVATKRKGWKLLDCRLLIRDVVDMRGVPFVDPETQQTKWAVPAEFPTEGKGVWFLDEINAAHPQVQAVAYQLVLDRAIGEYKLPDGWVVMAAGNNESDGAVTHKMPSALRNRFLHLDLEADLDDWVKWAAGADIHPMVIGFVRFKPSFLHAFDKNAKAFPTPRTWEFVSDIVKAGADPSVEDALYQGLVGVGAATDFSAFVRLYRQLPDIDLIIAEPTKARVPTELGALYAVAAALGKRATPKTFANIVTYLERLPVEFNVMAVTDMVSRLGTELASNQASRAHFTTWAHTHSDVML